MPEVVVASVEMGEDLRVRGLDAKGQDGLELLLTSLAACTGRTAIPVLRKMRQAVTGCRIEARGIRRERHPRILTAIELDITILGRGLDVDAVRKGVELAKTRYCPVWAMLSAATSITTAIRLDAPLS